MHIYIYIYRSACALQPHAKPASSLRQACVKPASSLRQACVKPASSLRQACVKPASSLRQTPQTLTRIPNIRRPPRWRRAYETKYPKVLGTDFEFPKEPHLLRLRSATLGYIRLCCDILVQPMHMYFWGAHFGSKGSPGHKHLPGQGHTQGFKPRRCQN